MTWRHPALGIVLVIAGACAATPAPSTTTTPTTASATPRSSPAPGTTLPSPGGESPAATAPDGTPEPTPSGPPSPTPTSAIVPGTVDRTSIEVSATYSVHATIGVANGSLDVATDIEVRNDSAGGIDRLDLNTIAAKLGQISITAATVDDTDVAAAVNDQTIRIPLGGILPDGATTRVRIAYRATLRKGLNDSDWMFSRAGGTIALYRWIPWVSRAAPFDRPNHGDPFVTPTSPRVDVEILTDQFMVLAAPAGEISDVPAGSGRAWSFSMPDVRDVSIVLAPDFTLTEGESGGIPIRVYDRPGGLSADRMLAQAEHALQAESARLGVDYPLAAFTLVETEGGFGLESPGLIWIPGNVDSTNLAYLVHHETAHQWFYGLVGNDQQADPFADEAAADLLARTTLGTLRSSRCAKDDLDRPITAYSQACYYEVVYVQGGLFLDDLRKTIGTDRFWAAMHDYLEAHRSGLSSTKALLDALVAASPDDVLPRLRSRFPSLY